MSLAKIFNIASKSQCSTSVADVLERRTNDALRACCLVWRVERETIIGMRHYAISK